MADDTTLVFEIKDRDGLARLGVIETKQGKVSTPNLAPVIHPLIQDISATQMREMFGAEIVMTNSYTLWRSDSKSVAVEKGLHSLLNFDGPIMTDSGAFQSHVYGDVETTNADIVAYQRDIGSDFGTVLDVFSEPEHKYEKAEGDVVETLKRTRDAVDVKGEMNLIGAVQGGLFPELRRRCAHELSKIDVAIQAIGGVVPLMEAYRFSDLVNVVLSSKSCLRPDRPVHLFGAGHPMVFALASLMGCDLFDSSSYDKYARAGRMMFTDGTRHIEELESLPCDCPACSSHSVDDFRKDRTLISRHNLYESFREIRTMRNAIKTGELWELVERRCHCHPSLLDALKELVHHYDYLERFEPPTRPGAFFYVGPESIHRPGIRRLRRLLVERYSPPLKETLVVFPEGSRPYRQKRRREIKVVLKRRDAHFVIKSTLGPVPIELDDFFPFSQSVVPERMDTEALEASEAFIQQFVRHHGYEKVVVWAGKESLEEVPMAGEAKRLHDEDALKVRAVADVQFGKDAAGALFGGKLEFVKSQTTNRIRNVLVDGKHILSMRAHDGMFTLKLEGGRMLHKAFPPPALRVLVETDTAEFNRQGKNVFAKFVLDCDPELRPMDECIIVDENDELVAVGQLFMSRDEMLTFERGVAVYVREGASPPP